MNNIVKSVSYLLVAFILAMGTFLVVIASADIVETPNPSVPEFMVEFVA